MHRRDRNLKDSEFPMFDDIYVVNVIQKRLFYKKRCNIDLH